MNSISTPNTRQEKRIGVFAKYWQPGKVKTRLASSIGKQAASHVYRCFVDYLVSELSKLPCDPILAYSPADDCTHDAYQTLVPENWTLMAQSEGNLGERIQWFFRSQFDGGAKSVVLIGSDSPNLPLKYIDIAMKALQTQELVLGPSEDGGYYLIGMAGGVVPILEGIPWSTPQVWEATLARVRELNVEPFILPIWYDVDEIRDLKRLLSDLRNLDSPNNSTKHLISELKAILGEV